MSGDWRETINDELPAFGLGDLEEGDKFRLSLNSEGKIIDTEYGNALQISVGVIEAPEGYEGRDGDDVEEGEDYHLLSSSNRFKAQLAEVAPDSLTGKTVTIEGWGEGFDRQYNVTEQ